MAKLKLQQEVLEALDAAALLPFSKAQRTLVSSLKSGQNFWHLHDNAEELRIAVAATIIHSLK